MREDQWEEDARGAHLLLLGGAERLAVSVKRSHSVGKLLEVVIHLAICAAAGEQLCEDGTVHAVLLGVDRSRLESHGLEPPGELRGPHTMALVVEARRHQAHLAKRPSPPSIAAPIALQNVD